MGLLPAGAQQGCGQQGQGADECTSVHQRPQDDDPAPVFGSAGRPAIGVSGPQISTRSVSCASAPQTPPVLSLAGPALPQAPNEQVCQMSGRDLREGGGWMLQAVRLDGPRRMI